MLSIHILNVPVHQARFVSSTRTDNVHHVHLVFDRIGCRNLWGTIRVESHYVSKCRAI